MASSSEPARDSTPEPPPSSRPKFPAPELLARLVVRCRELETFLRTAQGHLPRPQEAPFLFRQLGDVVARLQRGLAELGLGELSGTGEEDRGGFLRLFGGRKRRSPVSAYPEARSAGKARYDLQGTAWTVSVSEVIGFLSQAGKSGVLWVSTTSETFVLEFTRGSLVHAFSNAPPRACRLGEILVREGALDRATLEGEIARARSSEEYFGSHLVRSGTVTRDQLQQALTIQVQELFHRLMEAENATYGFQEGLQLLHAQSLEVNITHLLLESARKKDEARVRSRGQPPPPTLTIFEHGAPAAPEQASDEASAAEREEELPGAPNGGAPSVEGWARIEAVPATCESGAASAETPPTPAEPAAASGEEAGLFEPSSAAVTDEPPAALPSARADLEDDDVETGSEVVRESEEA